jgi:hypothetical protein
MKLLWEGKNPKSQPFNQEGGGLKQIPSLSLEHFPGAAPEAAE